MLLLRVAAAAAAVHVVAATVAAAEQQQKYQVQFGNPQLVGQCNFTHFWFPAGVMELGGTTTATEEDGGSTTATIVQRVRQAGDAEHCPPKDHPDWPCSAVRMSRARGSRWQVAPARWPGPLLPETPLNSKRAANPSNFSSIYALECVNASCAGRLARWSATVPPGTSGLPTLKAHQFSALNVQGVPPDLQLGVDALPVMLRCGSILLAMYVSRCCPGYLQRVQHRSNPTYTAPVVLRLV
jgi:hypothetical protein